MFWYFVARGLLKLFGLQDAVSEVMGYVTGGVIGKSPIAA